MAFVVATKASLILASLLREMRFCRRHSAIYPGVPSLSAEDEDEVATQTLLDELKFESLNVIAILKRHEVLRAWEKFRFNPWIAERQTLLEGNVRG